MNENGRLSGKEGGTWNSNLVIFYKVMNSTLPIAYAHLRTKKCYPAEFADQIASAIVPKEIKRCMNGQFVGVDRFDDMYIQN